MASTFNRSQQVIEGMVIVKFNLIAKDAADSALVDKFGDIMINPSGLFNDPVDPTFPQFLVQAGCLVPFFEQQEIKALFKSSILPIAVLERQANLWGNAIATALANAMIALRALGTVTDTTTMDVQVTF